MIAVASVALSVGAALVVRQATQPGRERASAERAATAINYGAGSPGLADEPPAVVAETPERIAVEVDKALASWRDAIRAQNAETVVALDAAFRASPQRYLPALRKSASGDADERVRAFSTRVLGKLKDATLAGLYKELLADTSPFVRQNAAWALGELAAADADGKAAARVAVAELRRARAKDPAPDVRAVAKGTLARLE
jgi:HEAT repeat protein